MALDDFDYFYAQIFFLVLFGFCDQIFFYALFPIFFLGYTLSIEIVGDPLLNGFHHYLPFFYSLSSSYI